MSKQLFKRRRRTEAQYTRGDTLCGLAITACIALLYLANVFTTLEMSVLDWLARLRGPRPAAPQVMIIEIGQESLDTIKKWPLPRDVYARLLTILADAGAHSVGFNVMFTEEGSPEKDSELARAIRRAGMVYLPYYIETLPQLGSYVRLIDNLPIFREAAKGEGHINMPPDVDGVVRHAILNIPFGDAGHWQLSFLMACDWLGVPREGITVSPGNIVQLKPAAGEMIAIPVDRNAAMIIDWYGPWRQCFAHCTLAEIFEAAEGAEGRHRDFSLENLEGRICLVGVTAPGTFDAMRTPFEHLAPSIAIHANILSQILQRRFMNALSRRSNVALIVLLGVASSFIVPRLKPSAAAAATLVGCAGAIALFIITVERYRLQVIVVHPVAALLLTYFAMSIRREITVSMERARLQHLATHDGLTGLCVVEHVRLLLDTEIAESRRKGRPLALVMADIDRFKDYNDRYGHQAGDFILREIARILQSSCRELDIAGRYGGEEFIIVLPDTRLGEAREVAERIRAAVERYPFTYGGERHAVTLSLGAAELHRMDSSDDLIRRADEALYQAKREGRNRVHVRESGRNKGIPITLE